MATIAVDPRTDYLLRLGDYALVLGQRVSAPFAQALAEDQRVIAETKQIIVTSVDRWGVDWRRGRHQMCFTSSGMS